MTGVHDRRPGRESGEPLHDLPVRTAERLDAHAFAAAEHDGAHLAAEETRGLAATRGSVLDPHGLGARRRPWEAAREAFRVDGIGGGEHGRPGRHALLGHAEDAS